MAVLAPFALIDADQHPAAVDVTDLQMVTSLARNPPP